MLDYKSLGIGQTTQNGDGWSPNDFNALSEALIQYWGQDPLISALEHGSRVED